MKLCKDCKFYVPYEASAASIDLESSKKSKDPSINVYSDIYANLGKCEHRKNIIVNTNVITGIKTFRYNNSILAMRASGFIISFFAGHCGFNGSWFELKE